MIHLMWASLNALVNLEILQIDLELESGEYFLSDKKKSAKKWQEKQEKQSEKTAEKKRKREAAFVPPKVAGLKPWIYS